MISIERLDELQLTEWKYNLLISKVRHLYADSYGSPGEEYVCKELVSLIKELKE